MTYLILNQRFLPGYKEKRKLLVPTEQLTRPKANQIAPHDLARDPFYKDRGLWDENGEEQPTRVNQCR